MLVKEYGVRRGLQTPLGRWQSDRGGDESPSSNLHEVGAAPPPLYR